MNLSWSEYSRNVLKKENEDLVKHELAQLITDNTFKHEVPLQSAQDGIVRVKGKKVVMLASNNYLGLSNHPSVRKAAIRGIKGYGYGVASVRFICGTGHP